MKGNASQSPLNQLELDCHVFNSSPGENRRAGEVLIDRNSTADICVSHVVLFDIFLSDELDLLLDAKSAQIDESMVVLIEFPPFVSQTFVVVQRVPERLESGKSVICLRFELPEKLGIQKVVP